MAEGCVVVENIGGIKVYADNGITDHDAEVNEFTDSLKKRVDAESDIVEDYLQPGEPQNGEKSNV